MFGVFCVKKHDFSQKKHIFFKFRGASPSPPPPWTRSWYSLIPFQRLRIENNMIFLRKIVIFHTKYPKHFHASLRNWKKYDFLALNRDFSHEIPQQFSRLPPLGVIFLSSLPPSLKSWIRP
jgi:hypothetical protein